MSTIYCALECLLRTKDCKMSEPKRVDFLRLVQHLKDIIRTHKSDLQINKIDDLIYHKYVILYANFNNCTSIEKTMFVLWALQNPDKVHYDIVQAIKPSVTVNIRDADATLVLLSSSSDPNQDGTAFTLRKAKELDKPNKCIIIDNEKTNVDQVFQWVKNNQFKTLNIAGPRESNCPGIYTKAYRFITAFLETAHANANVIGCEVAIDGTGHFCIVEAYIYIENVMHYSDIKFDYVRVAFLSSGSVTDINLIAYD